MCFIVCFNLAVSEPHVARVVASAVLIHGHETALAAALEKLRDRLEVDGQVRIAVERKKIPPQQREGLFQGSTPAQRRRAVETAFELDAPSAAVAALGLHHFPAAYDTQYHVMESLRPQPFQ